MVDATVPMIECGLGAALHMCGVHVFHVEQLISFQGDCHV